MPHTEHSYRIHRFHDAVAITFHDTKTLYLTPEMSREVGRLLIEGAFDTDHYSFTESQFPTTEGGA